MLKNENTNIVQTHQGKIKKRIFSSKANDQMMLQRNYFKRQQKSQRKSLNTQPVPRKNSPSIRDRKYYVKSGFNLNKNQIPTTQAFQIHIGNNSANSIFKRRVNSETKVSQKSISFVNQQITSQTVSKINYAKKIIEDLKRDTFKLQRNNSRFSSSNNSSKSVETGEKSLINRQKIIQNSMQKLKPSFNINEVKFCSSKKSLRKLANQSNIETKKNNINTQRPDIIRVQDKIFSYETKFHNSNEQFIRKMLKKSSQPLVSYSVFIKGRQNTQYYIKMQYFSQYLIISKNQNILVHVDFSALKLLQSIYLCLIDLLSIQIQDRKVKAEKLLNYQILKEYAEVYFQTYSKMKVEFILCERIFKTAKKKLIQFFVMQRIVFYWILQKCKTQEIIESQVGIKKVVEFLKQSEEILKTIISMLYEDLTKNNQQDPLIDTFKSLRLTRQIDKRLFQLKSTIQSIKQFDSSSNLLRCFIELLIFIEKQGNFDIIMMFQLQQYFNWTQQMIPPLFHLPGISSKPYTLIIDLDGTLIYYNEQTKILKYRPYMDRFLTAMQKYFEIIIFSSHTKDRTDIIVKEIERDEQIFAYRLYKSHLVFQEGILRKNIDYLGRSMLNLIFIDDEEKNTQLRPLNSFRIKPFTGDKQDKQLLNLADWLTNLVENQPLDIRGKLKKHQNDLDEVLEVDQRSSTIQPSIEYFEDFKIKKSTHKK